MLAPDAAVPTSARDSSGSENARHNGPALDLIAVAALNQPTLHVVPSGPTNRVDVSRTVFKACLPKKWSQRIQASGRVWFTVLTTLFWISQGIFVALPFFDHLGTLRLALSVANAVCALPALFVSTGCLSIDMIRIVSKENEYRFVTVLNTVNWCAVALTFADIRVCSCLIEWWIFQVAFLVDANFRLLELRLRSLIAAIPVVLAYLALALVSKLNDCNKPLLTAKGRWFTVTDLLLWTAPTLAVMLLKCLYHQTIRRVRVARAAAALDAAPDRVVPTTVIVYCSIHRVRLTLNKMSGFGSRKHFDALSRPRSQMGIPIVRSNSAIAYVDSTNTVTKLPFPLPAKTLTGTQCALLYLTGTLSFAALCYGTILTQIQTANRVSAAEATNIPYGALCGTIVFCLAMGRYYHRTLLAALLSSFDAAFTSLQFTSGVLLLCDMFGWDRRSINLISWTIWLHWVLCLDALTPPLREYIRLKKLAATPVVLFVLYAQIGPIVLLYGIDDTHLESRTLAPWVRTETLLVARILTLWLWNARLLWDVGVRDDSELLFLYDRAEYTAPRCAVFADELSRGSSGNAIVPKETINPITANETAHAPASSATPSPSSPRPAALAHTHTGPHASL